MEQTPHHRRALDLLNRSATFEEAWHPTSRAAAIEAALSETPVASFGLDVHEKPRSTVQYRIEKPAVRRWGGAYGGFTSLSGAFTIFSANQIDNPVVQVSGTVGGGLEITGGVVYGAGAYVTNPRWMLWGSQLGRYGGGPGIVILSGYNLVEDIQRGDVVNGVGDAGGLATGTFVVIGSSAGAGVAGAFTAGYTTGRVIDDSLGVSDDLSDRGVRVEDLWRDRIGAPDWLSHGLGFAGATPILGIGVEGISWGVYGTKWAGQKAWSSLKSAYHWVKYW